MFKIENLIFLVWETDDLDLTRRFIRVTDILPKGLVLDLEKGTWVFNGEEKDPTSGRTYFIGGRNRTREGRSRCFQPGTFPYGPIGVFDRTNIEHLDELVSTTEDQCEHRRQFYPRMNPAPARHE